MSEYVHCDAIFTSDKHTACVSDFPNSEIVGSVLYLGVLSRPNNIYAVDVLTHHLKRPIYCRVMLHVV